MAGERYIRFDWAIKRLLRHKADFVVVEGFLTSLLGEPLKIVEVLESEGNRQTADDKTNRVDVLVKDTKGRKIIIEIQNYFEDDYFHRMLYGASKVVTEHIKRGDAYGGIGKVYSVNIVFFQAGAGRGLRLSGQDRFQGHPPPRCPAPDERAAAGFRGRPRRGRRVPRVFRAACGGFRHRRENAAR